MPSQLLHRPSDRLLTLLDVKSYSAKTLGVFLELKLLPAWLTQHDVVDIPSFLANEERGFLFLLAFSHGRSCGSKILKNLVVHCDSA